MNKRRSQHSSLSSITPVVFLQPGSRINKRSQNNSLSNITLLFFADRFQNEQEKPAFDKSYIISQSDEESIMDGMSTYSAGAERARGVVSA